MLLPIIFAWISKIEEERQELRFVILFVQLTSISCGGGIVEKVFVFRRREVVRLGVCVRSVIEIVLRLATIPQRNLDQLACHKPTHVSPVPLHVQIRVDLYLCLHLLHGAGVAVG